MARRGRRFWFVGPASIGLIVPVACALPAREPFASEAVTLRAQSQPSEPPPKVTAEIGQPLTIDDLEALALENNPTIAQAAASIDMASGQMRQVGLYPNPQVGYLRSDSSPSGRFRSDGVLVV